MDKIFAIHSAVKSHLSKILPGNTFDPTDLFSPFSYGVSGVRGIGLEVERMKVAIFGVGAMGSVYAARLSLTS